MGNSCCGGAPTRQERVGPRAPPTLRPRARYDQDLREHLLGKSVPHKVELALTTATKFIARARLAHKVVVQRRTAGCSSEHAWNGRKTLTLAQEAELRQHMTREEKVADGLRLLVQRAEHVQVKIVHMEDDGNCQFRSLATELYGDQCYHAHVRAQIVEYMATHSENYRWMVEDLDDDGSRWQLYLRKMGTPRTWGDEMTLRAAADCFGCIVHVVTSEHENWLLNYMPDSLSNAMRGDPSAKPPEGTRECFLAYVSPIHYNVIMPLTEEEHAASVSGY